ncbi:SAM-dependent methyltransferase [hydrothermal vent metagenome]|uniref:SAM-dependent methyltransferase n=1 Tax=hydrothermal vent metagenome TaxID=652676 RepID=A0A1W1C8I9_9ZZZZ
MKLDSNKKIVLTKDGTTTLFSEEFKESYHSTYDGALHETLEKHVIPAFTFQKAKKDIKILDICFGLGYNVLATLYHIKKENLSTKVHIISPEFDESLIRSLSSFAYPKVFDEFKDIIIELSQNFYYEDEQFKIEILLGDARETIPKIKEKFDIIYQDAFSPKKNPLLWTREYFADIRAISSDDVILTTYSTAIATRMGLYENGFKIFIHYGNGVRYSTLATPSMIESKYLDMELKKSRSSKAKSLRDRDYRIDG